MEKLNNERIEQEYQQYKKIEYGIVREWILIKNALFRTVCEVSLWLFTTSNAERNEEQNALNYRNNPQSIIHRQKSPIADKWQKSKSGTQ